MLDGGHSRRMRAPSRPSGGAPEGPREAFLGPHSLGNRHALVPASLHEASLRDLLSHPAEGFVVTSCLHLARRPSLVKGVSFSHLDEYPGGPKH
jgi:hypothetical protein